MWLSDLIWIEIVDNNTMTLLALSWDQWEQWVSTAPTHPHSAQLNKCCLISGHFRNILACCLDMEWLWGSEYQHTIGAWYSNPHCQEPHVLIKLVIWIIKFIQVVSVSQWLSLLAIFSHTVSSSVGVNVRRKVSSYFSVQSSTLASVSFLSHLVLFSFSSSSSSDVSKKANSSL